MSKASKANRARRWKIYDDFSKNEYNEISDYFEIEEYPNKFYKIRTKEWGDIDFYPMSDKLFFVWVKWESNWLAWIKRNILKHL